MRRNHQERVNRVLGHLAAEPTMSAAEPTLVSETMNQLSLARRELWKLCDETNCNPILVRLAWHDSGTFDASVGISHWPKCGGANGSIRFELELQHGANAGLKKAVRFLGEIKKKFPKVTWADLIQLGSVVAIEHAGGPRINIRFGRFETKLETECPKEGNLPAPSNTLAGDGTASTPQHLRKIFNRMGFDDRGIVALSGAHTLGRAFKERSGQAQEAAGKGTPLTMCPHLARKDGKPGLGMQGGKSWTANWLTWDESYFVALQAGHSDKDLLRLESDSCLATDPQFKVFTKLYAQFPDVWNVDYAAAHTQLAESGSLFSPGAGFTLF